VVNGSATCVKVVGMGNPYIPTNIDEYLRRRLMPVEGAIPQLPGIEMFGNSVPAGAVGGDLFEYINFQQRYDIEGRIQLALKRSQEYLEKLATGALPRNSVDDHVNWLSSRPDFSAEKETAYRGARSSEQVRVAEDLRELRSTAGVLVVDAEGHGIIAAKIASTVHDTFQALMLSELDHRGKTSPELFERINLRLAQSSTARNALGRSLTDGVQEIATMLYGEIRPSGNFRFVNFGHPPPLVYSAEFGRFMELDKSRMVQFLPLGLQIREDHPDRNRYLSLDYRKRRVKSSELTLMNTGDIFFLYSDGVYSGGDKEERTRLEEVMRQHHQLSAKEICNSILDYALKRDDELRQSGEQDRIDDKTVVIIKRH
jgi:serine phosphatase RsbU (regulator of sigma subunit)